MTVDNLSTAPSTDFKSVYSHMVYKMSIFICVLVHMTLWYLNYILPLFLFFPVSSFADFIMLISILSIFSLTLFFNS